MIENEIRYDGFWIRFLAFIVDNIAGAILTLPLVAFITIDMTQLGDPEYVADLRTKLYLMILFVLVVIVACWKYLAATPGKLLFKAYIANAEDFQPASTTQLIVRALVYIPSFFIFGLGFVWIGLDKRKQGWHDKVAKTVVIKQKPVIDAAPN